LTGGAREPRKPSLELQRRGHDAEPSRERRARVCQESGRGGTPVGVVGGGVELAVLDWNLLSIGPGSGARVTLQAAAHQAAQQGRRGSVGARLAGIILMQFA
jgi:hypothetical protein